MSTFRLYSIARHLKFVALLIVGYVILPQVFYDLRSVFLTANNSESLFNFLMQILQIVLAIVFFCWSVFFLRGLKRLTVICIMMTSIALEDASQSIVREHFDPSFVMIALRELYDTAMEASLAYLPSARLGLGLLISSTIILVLPTATRKKSSNEILAFSTLFAAGALLALTITLTTQRTGVTSQAHAIAPNYSVWVKFAQHALKKLNPDVAVGNLNIDSVKVESIYAGTLTPKVDTIILIVDESVRGDVLEVNGGWNNTSPFLMKMRDGLINFGNSIATSNCSVFARFMLRAGISIEDIDSSRSGYHEGIIDWKQRFFQATTVWQYAKQAGYKTYHIDGWPSPLGHSFMSKNERKAIDVSIKVNSHPKWMRDIDLIENHLIPIIQSESGRKFILIEKYGIHFPYSNKYPPEFGLENGLSNPSDSLEDIRALHDNYAVAVKWTSDEFLKALLRRVKIENTLIVYTSDHGQALLQSKSRASHCNSLSTASNGELFVPFFMFTGDAKLKSELVASAERVFSRTSQFETFPSLLNVMGFDKDWVRRNYGHSVFDENARLFSRGVFGVTFDRLEVKDIPIK